MMENQNKEYECTSCKNIYIADNNLPYPFICFCGNKKFRLRKDMGG